MGKSNRIGLEGFLSKAHEIHGDYYDYSKSVYAGVKTKLVISCPEHGEFEQSPEMHLKGHGCRKCAAAKRQATMMSRYGVAFSMQSEEVKQKSEQTRQEKFGSQKPPGSGKKRMTLDEFVSRSVKTHGNKYDYSHVVMNGTEAKVEIICPHHGAFMQTPAKHLKGRGCPHPECIRQKKIDTNMARFGVPNAMQSKEVIDRLKESNLEKYGVACTFELDDVKEKGWRHKIEAGTCNTSKSQGQLYGMLCNAFGADDVMQEYISDVYPYHCDFYIKSRDLYVELNGNFTHGLHWYDVSDKEDKARLELLKSRREEKDSAYYANAIAVWTGHDVEKRAAARKGNLNYVVFWGTSLKDAALWFTMGCPDGKDWDKEYSWLPNRTFSVSPEKMRLTGTMSNLSQVAKHYQFPVFYGREIGMWKENPMLRGSSLQVFLYHNRLKYIGKTPDELTDFELARGFTIAGIMKGYTVFHAGMMDDVVSRYGIASVYDPCAGWGERALYCKSHGDIPYLGIDVNQNLFPGYEAMSKVYDMRHQRFVHGDSAGIALQGHYDAVVTCPPYGNMEIYSPDGAENLSDDKFLEWWDNVVTNSFSVCPRLFCFQVNRKWRDAMLHVVEQHEFKLAEEVLSDRKRSSHFTRGKNGEDYKKEFETMLVCMR